MDGRQTFARRRGFKNGQRRSRSALFHYKFTPAPSRRRSSRSEKKTHGSHHVASIARSCRRDTTTAYRPSTSTTWNRRWPSWKPPAPSMRRSSSRPRAARAPTPTTSCCKHMMDAVTEIYPHIPVCVHLDHGNEPATCMTAIQAGFTSVMMDGSLKADGKTPGD